MLWRRMRGLLEVSELLVYYKLSQSFGQWRAIVKADGSTCLESEMSQFHVIQPQVAM